MRGSFLYAEDEEEINKPIILTFYRYIIIMNRNNKTAIPISFYRPNL